MKKIAIPASMRKYLAPVTGALLGGGTGAVVAGPDHRMAGALTGGALGVGAATLPYHAIANAGRKPLIEEALAAGRVVNDPVRSVVENSRELGEHMLSPDSRLARIGAVYAPSVMAGAVGGVPYQFFNKAKPVAEDVGEPPMEEKTSEVHLPSAQFIQKLAAGPGMLGGLWHGLSGTGGTALKGLAHGAPAMQGMRAGEAIAKHAPLGGAAIGAGLGALQGGPDNRLGGALGGAIMGGAAGAGVKYLPKMLANPAAEGAVAKATRVGSKATKVTKVAPEVVAATKSAPKSTVIKGTDPRAAAAAKPTATPAATQTTMNLAPKAAPVAQQPVAAATGPQTNITTPIPSRSAGSLGWAPESAKAKVRELRTGQKELFTTGKKSVAKNNTRSAAEFEKAHPRGQQSLFAAAPEQVPHGGLGRSGLGKGASVDPECLKFASLVEGFEHLLDEYPIASRAAMMAVPGAGIGAAEDKEHRGRGALVGAASGGLLGGLLGAVSQGGDLMEETQNARRALARQKAVLDQKDQFIGQLSDVLKRQQNQSTVESSYSNDLQGIIDALKGDITSSEEARHFHHTPSAEM